MKSVLIANRGEIACRIIRSCRALGLEAVAVHSEADSKALHVREADRAVLIGPAPARDSYLKADRLIEAARQAGADAIHPGYGFLAENARFAEAVIAAGLTWVGPRPTTIADMGDKERGRLLAKAAGVPIVPGSSRFGPNDVAGLDEAAAEIGYPLLVKALGGGGGIGMRRVDRPERLAKSVGSTQAAAAAAFGNGDVYLERLIDHPRHIEVQVFGFGDGHGVALGERDCSIQRRYQKVVEETPAPGVDANRRRRLEEAALALVRQERYTGAGTVEFIMEPSGAFYFLEMNTRIQVEHTVTEAATGLDLIGLQLRLARGDDLHGLRLEEVELGGHAIQARLYAENPAIKFLPQPGRLERFELPDDLPGIRLDTGVASGDTITVHYDPLIAKVIAHGPSREEARARLIAALAALDIDGPVNNRDFLLRVLDHPAFIGGGVSTAFVDDHLKELIP